MRRAYDLAAILDGIRDGELYRDIAERHDVSRALVSKLAVSHDLRRRPQYTSRPTRHHHDASDYRDPTPADGLPDGDWVIDRRTRVLRWEAAA